MNKKNERDVYFDKKAQEMTDKHDRNNEIRAVKREERWKATREINDLLVQ